MNKDWFSSVLKFSYPIIPEMNRNITIATSNKEYEEIEITTLSHLTSNENCVVLVKFEFRAFELRY